MLRDWLKNIVRLFSAYLNKETRKKLLCHNFKFYLGVSSILQVTSHVMSILRNLERIKARRKANSIETRCHIDSTKLLDSADLLQRTHQVTVPSRSEINPGLLDYKTARDAGTSGLKKSKSYYQKYSPDEQYNIATHASEFGTASTLRRFKTEFPQLRRALFVRYVQSMRKNLKLR